MAVGTKNITSWNENNSEELTYMHGILCIPNASRDMYMDQ